jgi:hypothetical protein
LCAKHHRLNKRATWTLHPIADELVARVRSLASISHESVRRVLLQRNIRYRCAKAWLTSPDPLYELHKAQRDRLLRLARQSPDGAAVWWDESWFVRWPYRYWNWSVADRPPRVKQRWDESVERTALYAALDDESQTACLHWADGQPNSERTIGALEKLMDHWNRHHTSFIGLFWDRAPYHTSRQTRTWIKHYNQRANRQGLTRLLVCLLPTRSRWLMPLEPVFGHVKHQALGDRAFDTVANLQTAVVVHFKNRGAAAKKRRDKAWQRLLEQAA